MKLKKLNNKGSLLIVAYVALYALITLSAGLALFNFNELSNARRYKLSSAAFWLAEAGVNMFMKDTNMLDEKGNIKFKEKLGNIKLRKNDTDPTKRTVTSTGIVKGVKKSVEITYLANPPEVFRNTISVNGDIKIVGVKSMLTINDKTQLSGEYMNESKYSTIIFEDKKEEVESKLVTMTYPDADKSGTADEFNDFIQYNRKIIKNYPSDEILYIKGSGTYTISPTSSLAGKKIVYVEGKEGKGNVVVQFGGGLKKGQKITIIATGNVTVNQAGWAPPDSQLNVIAWSGYKETAVLPGSSNGMVYTHGVASFDDIYDTSITNGSIVANQGIEMKEIWSMKTFNYKNVTTKNVVPFNLIFGHIVFFLYNNIIFTRILRD